eukprot:COSAG02_NODE_3240_length_7111_cov_9.714632_5_plen_58_part_00
MEMMTLLIWQPASDLYLRPGQKHTEYTTRRDSFGLHLSPDVMNHSGCHQLMLMADSF